MKLILTLEFGNDAMQTYGEALRAVTESIKRNTLSLSNRATDGAGIDEIRQYTIHAREVKALL